MGPVGDFLEYGLYLYISMAYTIRLQWLLPAAFAMGKLVNLPPPRLKNYPRDLCTAMTKVLYAWLLDSADYSGQIIPRPEYKALQYKTPDSERELVLFRCQACSLAAIVTKIFWACFWGTKAIG